MQHKVLNMAHKSNNKPFEVKFFLSDEENRSYEVFLMPFAGKKGPYAKKMILDRIKASTTAEQVTEVRE